ncbi:MAG TPA: hypothetical protein VGQ46_00410 [Thermoanaerobaculia bacterium]|jgi:hypothetical protein|nr:hypothetical protein [Thermoanaerobaculia bacterium]
METIQLTERDSPARKASQSLGYVSAIATCVVMSWSAGDFHETHDGPMWFVYGLVLLLSKGAQAIGARRGWPFAAASVVAAILWGFVAMSDSSPGGGPSYIFLVLIIWGVLELVRLTAGGVEVATGTTRTDTSVSETANSSAAPPPLTADAVLPRSESSRPLSSAKARASATAETIDEREAPLAFCYHCGTDVQIGTITCNACGKEL